MYVGNYDQQQWQRLYEGSVLNLKIASEQHGKYLHEGTNPVREDRSQHRVPNHERAETSSPRLSPIIFCTDCGELFPNKSTAEKHWRMEHDNCLRPICRYKSIENTDTEAAIKIHTSDHQREYSSKTKPAKVEEMLVKCKFCDELIPSSSDEMAGRQHLEQYHEDKSTESCPFCARRYWDRYSLLVHVNHWCFIRNQMRKNEATYWEYVTEKLWRQPHRDPFVIKNLLAVAALPERERRKHRGYPKMVHFN